MLMSISILGEKGVPVFWAKNAEPNGLSAPCLRGLRPWQAAARRRLRHGQSKKRELSDPSFDECGKPSKASSAKVNVSLRGRLRMPVLSEVLKANETYAASFGAKSQLAMPPARRFAIEAV
jgi:hypothetical protein